MTGNLHINQLLKTISVFTVFYEQFVMGQKILRFPHYIKKKLEKSNKSTLRNFFFEIFKKEMIFRKSKNEKKKSVKLIDELFCGSFLNFSGPLCIILIHHYIVHDSNRTTIHNHVCIWKQKKCQQLFHHINSIIKQPSLIAEPNPVF